MKRNSATSKKDTQTQESRWVGLINQEWKQLKESGDLVKLIVFLFAIMMISIFITQYVEQQKVELNSVKKEAEEMEWLYKSRRADLTNMTKQSGLVDRLKAEGYEELREPPKVITYTAEDLK